MHDRRRPPRMPSAGRHRGYFALLLAVAGGAAACGSSAPSTAASAPAAPSHSSGAAPAATASGTSAGGSVGGLDLAKLGALTDYSATLTANGTAITTVRVHSATDWETFTGSPVPLSVDVGGSEYSRVPVVSGTQVHEVWQRLGPAQPYQQTPYPSEAAGFAGLTHVTGVTLQRGGTCSEAGVAGHQWRLVASGGTTFSVRGSACVADRSGALLSFDEGASGTVRPAGDTTTFTITGVGDVPPIPVPSSSGSSSPGPSSSSGS